MTCACTGCNIVLHMQPLLSRALITSLEMAEVTQQWHLSYLNGPKIPWPPNLLLTLDDGSKWAKCIPSHYAFVKFVLGHLPEFKNTKNASLASSPKWQEVWRMIKQKVIDSMNDEDDAGPDVFSSQKSEKSEEEKLDPRAVKRQLQKLPSTMTLNLMDVDCTFRTPGNLKQSELVIQLDSKQLTAFCGFLMEDIGDVLKPKPTRQDLTMARRGRHLLRMKTMRFKATWQALLFWYLFSHYRLSAIIGFQPS